MKNFLLKNAKVLINVVAIILLLIIGVVLFQKNGAENLLGARTESYWSSVGSYIKTSNLNGYNVLINGVDKYLNFGSISGISGHGIRDNNGTMEVKDSGGSWTSVLGGTTGVTTSTAPLIVSGNSMSIASGYEIPLTASTSNWQTAYTDRLKWDGGATGLTAATGRTSLGLGSMAVEASTSYPTLTYANTTYAAETTSTIGTLINGSTATTAPADTDRFSFSASSLLRHITWALLKVALKDYFDPIYGAINGQVWTGTHDFGGASLEIPNGATCNVSGTTGKICLDTTDNQIQIYGTSATSTLSPLLTPSFTIASTTLTGGAATSTIPLGYAGYNETWSSAICGTSGGTGVGTTTLRFGDGTNWTNVITATSTAYDITLSSNNAFTLSESRQIQIMTTAGSPNYITCTIHKTIDPD